MSPDSYRFLTMLVSVAVFCGSKVTGPAAAGEVNAQPQCLENAYEYLRRAMDAYHGDRYWVYEDIDSPGNHFLMWHDFKGGDAKVRFDAASEEAPQSGASCVRFEFEYGSETDWVAFIMQNGVWREGGVLQANDGANPDAGIDLSGAKSLRFYARGEKGGEKVEFFMGGMGRDPETGHPNKKYPDSSARYPPMRVTTSLTNVWKEYEIDLSGRDLSHVIAGFGWAANALGDPDLRKSDSDRKLVFFVDDIHFELDATGISRRQKEPRFIRSFTTLPLQNDPQPVGSFDHRLRNTAFVYDNALAILAFLAEKSPDGLRRAKLIGDALVYACAHDRQRPNERIRDAYAAGDLTLPPGWTPNGVVGEPRLPGFYDPKEKRYSETYQNDLSSGNVAWAMIALMALHRNTQDAVYRKTAVTLGDFVSQNLKGMNGKYQGFLGGLGDAQSDRRNSFQWASTEHNLDLFAAFAALAKSAISKIEEDKWTAEAEHARRFVDTMWEERRGRFLTGTIDPNNRNENVFPLDVQPWSVLAMSVKHRDKRVLEFAREHHQIETEDRIGFDFNEDRDGIWFEGTAHMATAYRILGLDDRAAPLMETLCEAQLSLPRSRQSLPVPFKDPIGLVAGDRNGISTGFDFQIMERLHIGATAWFIFALRGVNPYYLDF